MEGESDSYISQVFFFVFLARKWINETRLEFELTLRYLFEADIHSTKAYKK